MMNKLGLVASILIGAVSLHVQAQSGTAPAFGLSKFPTDRPIVMGYVNALRSSTGHEQTLSAAQVVTEMQGIHWAGYDAVVHAFAEPIDSDGSIGESLGNFQAYQSSLITEAHARNKSVILSVGGAYPARLQNQFLAIATDNTKRANFVANLVSYMKTKGYDGVDIDWEFPDAGAGKAALTQLMTDLYAAVKAEHSDYIVMFGTGPAYYMGGYDFAALKDHADFFFYFGYDWKGASPSGANGPIKQPGSGQQWTTANDTLFEKSVRGGIQYVIDKGFPANKIICGLPFYGSNNISWSAVRDTWAANQATYDAAIDADAMEVKINNVWYTTPKAMKMKMDALLKTGSSVLNNSATIRGVGTWEIGHEHRSNPDLSKAFEEWIADFSGSPVLPKISVADASVAEGDTGTSNLAMTVTLDRAATAEVTVDYATSNGTATSGSDYTATSGTLTFAAGETSKAINIPVIGDTTDETDESFTLTLSNSSVNAVITDSTATGTITDDDTAAVMPSLTIAGATVVEGNSGTTTATLNVTLSPAPSSAVTVDWATLDGTATSGSDYTSGNGTLSFASGETSKTITLSITGDTTVEPSETITVTLSNPSGATLGTAVATVTITNDDTTDSNGQPGWTRHFQPSDGVSVSYVTPTGSAVWSSGFSGKIEITNNGSALDTWTLTFDAPWTTTGSGNAGSWNISGNQHTVTQPTWGGYSVARGAKITLDFTGSGVWSEPTNLKFNGNAPGSGAEGNVQLTSWKTTHGITDITSDSNRNGLPDLVDFLVGNNPSNGVGNMQPLVARVCELTVDGQSDTYFCVELDADTKAEGVEYRIELSDDLSTWTAGTNVMVVHETSTNANGSTHAVWRSAQPVGEEDTEKFARLIAREIGLSGNTGGNGGSSGGGSGGEGSGGGTTGPAGAPNVPSVSILKDWTDGVGHKITWNTWGGAAATEWKLYQNDVLIHTGSVTGNAPQTAEYDFNQTTIGAFTYKVELSNNEGTSASAPKTFLTDFASPMNLTDVDTSSQVSQVTVDPGQSTLTINGGKSPYTVVVNHPAALSASVSGNTVTLNGTAGMRSGLKITDADGNVRLIGVRVKNADGSNPGLPSYLSIGSVSEDSTADLDFFADYQPNTRKNKWVDYRYIYINGGVKRKGVGWRTWTNPKDGDRMRKFVRESIKRGMLPVIVWYNIPDGGESYTTDLEHMQEEDYMQGYFEDLKFAIDIANEEAGDEMVLWVLEPDFIGYMAQNNENPATLMAQTNAAYDVGVLDTSAGDPLFPDTMRGMIEAINYMLKKHSNNAYIGWQFNLWAFPAGGWVQGSQVGVKGLMRVTDDQGMTAGRATVRAEGLAVADYYISCGILTHGADFVSIDKYGLDGGAEQKNDNPSESTWFWNAEHWGNYLHYCKALHDRTGKQVMLWQLPVGHINSSQLVSPYTNVVFADHPNQPRDWEDSAPTFFFGDTFKPGAGNRYNWFSQNRGGHSSVSLDADGETITWGSHMQAARDAGIHIMLFGDGVGNSTRGRGDTNTDEFWWITAAQDYYANPVPLNPSP